MRLLMKHVYFFKLAFGTFFLFLSLYVNATEYALPKEKQRLIGQDFQHKIIKGDYFQQLAEEYDVGFLALIQANPEIDPYIPKLDSEIIIPKAMLLPFIKHQGIVVNLPELRLYYFDSVNDKVHVFPVGIGKQGFATPLATSYISEKRKNPVWRPTKAMRERYFTKHGKQMAKEVPAGKNNPFGKYALRLGTSEYLLHGTNKRFGIGMRASSGCIRLYDDDIKWLYDHVPMNTEIRIINQPIKMSFEDGTKRLIEIHSPLSEKSEQITVLNAERSIRQKKQFQVITPSIAMHRFIGANREYWQQLLPEIEQPRGLVIGLKQAQ